MASNNDDDVVWDFYDALDFAVVDADGARDVLLVIADYLAETCTLPPELASFLTQAIQDAMSKATPKERNRALLRNLHLTAGHRRPQVNRQEVGERVWECISHGASQNEAAELVAVEYKISPSTAVRAYKKMEQEYEQEQRERQASIKEWETYCENYKKNNVKS